MKLTKDSVDKWFKTSAGRKVKDIYCKNNNHVFYCPEYGQVWTSFADGTPCFQGKGDDIIAEWHEPIEREVTVYLFDDGSHGLLHSPPITSAIASTRVKLIEGEFA